jgi:hypothetical protein
MITSFQKTMKKLPYRNITYETTTFFDNSDIQASATIFGIKD